jgi:hypothetical protein
MLEEGLHGFLAAAPSITAIIGTSDTRSDKASGIFPSQMPEDTPLPAIVYVETGTGEDIMTMDGPSSLHNCRKQFTCYAKNYFDAKRLAREVRIVLENFVGLLPDGTEVQNMWRVGEQDAFSEAPFIYQAPVEFEIWYVDTGN